MNANQAEATKHQSESIIHALPTAGLTQNGVYREYFLALIYNLAERQTQTYAHYSGINSLQEFILLSEMSCSNLHL